jgi:hypothetical protein
MRSPPSRIAALAWTRSRHADALERLAREALVGRAHYSIEIAVVSRQPCYRLCTVRNLLTTQQASRPFCLTATKIEIVAALATMLDALDGQPAGPQKHFPF